MAQEAKVTQIEAEGELGPNAEPLDPWSLGLPSVPCSPPPRAPFQQVSGAHLVPGTEGQNLSLSEGQRACTVSGSSALAGGLGFLVYLFKIIAVCFFVFFVKAPVFANEVGKLVQLKQDRAFQAGVLVSHFESVLLPSSVGGAVRGRGIEGVMPLSPPPTPVLASQSDRHFCRNILPEGRSPSLLLA